MIAVGSRVRLHSRSTRCAAVGVVVRIDRTLALVEWRTRRSQVLLRNRVLAEVAP